jgi:hypothetical protein
MLNQYTGVCVLSFLLELIMKISSRTSHSMYAYVGGAVRGGRALLGLGLQPFAAVF